MNISDLLNLYSQQGQGQERWQGRAQQEQPANNQGSLSANMLGDYNPQPRYGPQANPWQEQLMSQLFQQQETAKRDKPEKTGGGGK